MYSSINRIKRVLIDTLKLDSVVVVFNETPIIFKEVEENTLDGKSETIY